MKKVEKTIGKAKMIKTTACNHCKTDASLLEKAGVLNNLDVIDENNPRFNQLIEDFGINSAPTYIIDHQTCKLTKDEKGRLLFQCDNGEKKELNEI